jgi:hypothetical protein
MYPASFAGRRGRQSRERRLGLETQLMPSLIASGLRFARFSRGA